MERGEFLDYVASFNPEYATETLGQSLIKEAKRIKDADSKETHDTDTKESVQERKDGDGLSRTSSKESA